MYAGKPIIGITGGIGSGKSFVAGLFAEAGCLVIDSDAQVSRAYEDEQIKTTLREWWGGEVFNSAGQINRTAVARRIFTDEAERLRLQGLLFPAVDRMRREAMDRSAYDAQVLAYVWDTPLLMEVGLDKLCDTVVFVDAPEALRLLRVRQQRGWEPAELARREILQMPLDKKRGMSDYIVSNTADAEFARSQVRGVLSRIFNS